VPFYVPAFDGTHCAYPRIGMAKLSWFDSLLATSYFEVAESNSWKCDVVCIFGPVGVRDEMFHHVDAECGVASRQDAVQHEQLAQHVDDVAKLREQK